ncbi:MAG: T9SS type A sorting domain-containing protein, partial [Bacteroidota bacterium]
MTVYPNPSQGLFTLSVENDQLVGVSVHDAAGRLIRELKGPMNNSVLIDLSNAAKGIYSLQIETLNSNKNERVIVT